MINTAQTSKGRPGAIQPLQPNRKRKRKGDPFESDDDDDKPAKLTRPDNTGNGSKIRLRAEPTGRRAKRKGQSQTAPVEEAAEPPSSQTLPVNPVYAVKTITQWDGRGGGLGYSDIDILLDLLNCLSTRLARKILFMRTPSSDLHRLVKSQWYKVSTKHFK